MKFFSLLLFTLTLSITACGNGAGPESKEYCEAAVLCEGSNNRDYKACLESWEYEKERARVYGCGAEFYNVRDCVVFSATCESFTGTYGLLGIGNCDGDIQVYDACLEASSADPIVLFF